MMICDHCHETTNTVQEVLLWKGKRICPACLEIYDHMVIGEAVNASQRRTLAAKINNRALDKVIRDIALLPSRKNKVVKLFPIITGPDNPAAQQEGPMKETIVTNQAEFDAAIKAGQTAAPPPHHEASEA